VAGMSTSTENFWNWFNTRLQEEGLSEKFSVVDVGSGKLSYPVPMNL